ECVRLSSTCVLLFFTDPVTSVIYPLSLHDALPIYQLSWADYFQKLTVEEIQKVDWALDQIRTEKTEISVEHQVEEQLAELKNTRSEEHTSELQSRFDLVCRLLLEKKKQKKTEKNSQ